MNEPGAVSSESATMAELGAQPPSGAGEAGPTDRAGWLLELLDRTARFESEAAALMEAWRQFDATLDTDEAAAGEAVDGGGALIADLLGLPGYPTSCRARGLSGFRPRASRRRPRR